MQNSKQKFRQRSIVFEKPRILPEKLKTLTSSNYLRVEYLLLKFCTHFPLINVYKNVFGIYFNLFRSWVILQKLKKTWFLHTHRNLFFFTFLLITRDLNKVKKSRTPFSRHCYVEDVCKTSAENVQLCNTGSPQSFQFFRQVT